MKIIKPLSTLCTNIVYSNVAQDAPVWSSTVTYDKGDLAAETGCGAIVYESLVNSNLNNPLETSPLEWLPIGASNYFAMFDDKNGTQTESLDSIDVVVDFTDTINSVALINIQATTARFQAWRADQNYLTDTPVMDYEVPLRDYGVSSWYEYYTYQVKQKRNYVNFDLPTFIGGTGRLTLDQLGQVVKIGSLLYGNTVIVGDTVYGLNAGIKDYSTKETDVFGNYTIVEREFRDTVSAQVIVEESRTQIIKDLLADNRARPLLFTGDEAKDLSIIYGFYTRFNINMESPAYSKLDLTIEGI